MIEKIGVIRGVSIGACGYQECMLGFSFDIQGKGWGTVHEIIGGWGHVSEEELNKGSSTYKWTHAERITGLGEAFWKVNKLLQQAKVSDVQKLVGKPVKVFFESELGRNTGFEILTDAIL